MGVKLGHWSRGLYAELVAIFLLGACVTWDPFASELERGNVALHRGDFYAATDSYQRALGHRRDDPDALYGLARSYIGRGDGENALEVFLILRRVEPAYFEQRAPTDYHVALYQAAKTRLSRGNSGMALELLRRLRERDPDHGGLDELLTQALIAEGGSAGMASSVPSDALLRQPDDPQLQGRMDREPQIRYPDGLPDLAPAGAPEIAAEAPPAWEAAPEADAVPKWQPIPEREYEEVSIEPDSWPPTGWDTWPDEGPEPADDPANAR